MSDTVTISYATYKRLIDAEEILAALHAGGVDNWDFYYESLRDAGLIDNEDDDDNN